VTAWLICAAIAAVLGLATWGLASRTSREMPPYPPPPGDRPWQPEYALYRCSGCGTLRPLDVSGMVAAHDRPDPWVPYDQQSAPCQGAGLPPETPAPPGTPDPRGVGTGLPGDAPTPG
jgi:hypothetical protein